MFHIMGWYVMVYPIIMVMVWISGMYFYNTKLSKIINTTNFNIEEKKFIILCSVFNEEGNVVDNIKKNLEIEYENYEFWYVDDLSTDGTAHRMREFYNDKVKFHYETENSGKASVLNKYIKLVEDEYVLIIDSDTILDKKALLYLNGVISNYPNYSAYTGNIIINPRKGKINDLQRLEYRLLINTIKKAQFYFTDSIMTVSGACTCFRTDSFDSIPFKTNVAAEDIDYSWRSNLSSKRIMYASNVRAYIDTPSDILELIRQRKRWTVGLLNSLDNKFIFKSNIRNYIYLLEIILSSIWGTLFLIINLLLIFILIFPHYIIVNPIKLLIPIPLLLTFSFVIHYAISKDSNEKLNFLDIFIYCIFYFWIQPVSFVLGCVDNIFTKRTGRWRGSNPFWKEYLLETTIDLYAHILLPVFVFHISTELLDTQNFLIFVYLIYSIIYYDTNIFYVKKISPLKKYTLYLSLYLMLLSLLY